MLIVVVLTVKLLFSCVLMNWKHALQASVEWFLKNINNSLRFGKMSHRMETDGFDKAIIYDGVTYLKDVFIKNMLKNTSLGVELLPVASVAQTY